MKRSYWDFLLLHICCMKWNLEGCFRLKNLILSKAEAPWWLLLLLRCTTAFTLGCVPAFIPLFCHKAIFTQCCSSFSSFFLGNICLQVIWLLLNWCLLGSNPNWIFNNFYQFLVCYELKDRRWAWMLYTNKIEPWDNWDNKGYF